MMRHFATTIAAFVLLGLTTAMSVPVHAQDQKRRVSITIDKHPSDLEMTAWTAYGVSLGAFIQESGIAAASPEGPYIPSFEAELAARQRQLKIWRELNEKGRYRLKYMDDLQAVEAAGFLREYLWRHHAREMWGAPPAGLRHDAFFVWEAQKLPGHVPHTGARVIFGPQIK